MKIIDIENEKIVSRKFLTNLLIEYETNDIISNWNDYKTEYLNIYTQCELIRNINNMTTKEIIYRLNNLWSECYEIIK